MRPAPIVSAMPTTRPRSASQRSGTGVAVRIADQFVSRLRGALL
jgi:hypothetical protein